MINLRFAFDDSLLCQTHIDKFQQSLVEIEPSWAKGLHIYSRGQQPTKIDSAQPGALLKGLNSFAFARGDTYQKLVKIYGVGPYERITGSAELRGSNRSIIVIAHFDEWAFAPISGSWIFGNSITLQVTSPWVRRESAHVWSQTAFEILCNRLNPAWAAAYSESEYEDKNISREDGGMASIGNDISRYLPGIYWLNFFGPPYCNLIGRDRLLSAPAVECKSWNQGVFLRLSDHPDEWISMAYKAETAKLLNHIGTRYFFDRYGRNDNTVAPAFVLPMLGTAKK
jgi:hypothetical protein